MQKQTWWDRSLGTFSPWSLLWICLHEWLPREDFCFKDLPEERTREQFSSVILLVPIQKGRVRMEHELEGSGN